MKVSVMVEPYYHVRFRWDEPLDLGRTKTMLSGSFRVTMVGGPRKGAWLAFQPEERGKLRVASDTLSAILEPFRAVIFQKEAKPFTRLDVALRNEVAQLYDKMGPFSSEPIPEPSFEVEK